MTVSRFRNVAILFVMMLGVSRFAEAQRAIFLVRHAEKVDNSQDADLSDAGARAGCGSGPDAEGCRRHDGLQQRLSAHSRDRATTGRRARRQGDCARSRGADRRPPAPHASKPDTVLLVAHSDTLPGILRGLGHREPVTIADADYDNLFIVMPRAGAPPTVVRLHY